jgi:hypothetical protein
MNFYFDAANLIDRVDAKRGSVKSLLNTLPEKSRKRTAALVIETLKCKWMRTEYLLPGSDTTARQVGACGSDRSGKSPEE